ncbi:hypothetical protein QTN47_03515 [Danxiaibacter flavus]|uniref:Transposase IS200-like domain-containing protein n=1 Tax=Danxiaibacter flavus TaxID=3049108 RepID=A0ABV3ZAJ1_9BACT|nr:hypothetical protein QNM32_03515 [Chitinophagaceae bacterium DXS]
MSVRKLIPETDGVYFITFTCARWLPLFKIINGYDVVYNWFNVLKQKGHFIIGYVVMPDHVHAIIAFRNTGKQINKTIGNGKRFMAYEIVRRLKNLGCDEVLEQMQGMVNNTQKLLNKHHEVFEPSFDWKECRTEKFIIQKLDYIHWNPCKSENRLVELPEQYEHSSAKYYIAAEQGAYAITSYMELEDVNLTI